MINASMYFAAGFTAVFLYVYVYLQYIRGYWTDFFDRAPWTLPVATGEPIYASPIPNDLLESAVTAPVHSIQALVYDPLPSIS